MLSSFLVPAAAGAVVLPCLAQAPPVEFLSVNGVADADAPIAQAWSADGSALLVVHEATGDVSWLTPQLEARVEVGAGPLDIAVCPRSGRAYVPNSLDSTLSVIDVDEARVIETVALSGSLPCQVEITSTGSFAFVSCVVSDSVSVVDLVALTEVATFPTVEQGAAPGEFLSRPRYRRMALGPDDRTLALPGVAAVGVYDVTTGAALLVSTHFGLDGEVPIAAAFGPSGRHLAVLYREFFGGGLPRAIDLETGLNRGPCDNYYGCPAAVTPESLVVSPVEEVALIASEGDDMIFLDLETADTTATATAAGSSVGLSPDGRHAFVAGDTYFDGGPGLSIIDLQTRSTLMRLRHLEFALDQVTVHPSGLRIAGLEWQLAERSDWFDWTDQGLTRIASVTTGPPPEGDGPQMFAADGRGDRVVSANLRSGSITILERSTGQRHVVETGGTPSTVAMDEGGKIALVGHRDGGPLTLVDLENRRLAAEVDAGYVRKLAVSPDGKRAYVTDSGADRLYIIDTTEPERPRVATVPIPGYSDYTEPRLAVSRANVVAVPRYGENRLTLIDGVHGTVLVDLVAQGIRTAAFSPDGRYVYATLGAGVRRARVDGVQSSWAGQAALSGPGVVQVSQDGSLVFVARSAPAVAIVDARAMRVLSEVPMSSWVRGIQSIGRNVFVRINNRDDIQRLYLHNGGFAVPADPLVPSAEPIDFLATADGVLYSVPELVDGLDAWDFSTTERFPPVLGATIAPGPHSDGGDAGRGLEDATR